MILVTGGIGLVGSHLMFSLLRAGKSIRAIYRKGSNLHAVKKVFSYYIPAKEAENLFQKIEWVEADIVDIPALALAFEKIEQVYHCAALVSFDVSREKELRKINIEGTANIVNLCMANKVERLGYVSSIAALGAPSKGKKITENSKWNPEKPHSDYTLSKYGAEMEIWRGSQEGLSTFIVNPGVIIGPGFWHKGSGLLFSKIAHGLHYTIPKTTGFVGVWDVISALSMLMNSPTKTQRYILVAENAGFDRVLKLIAEKLNKPVPSNSLKPWMIQLGWIFQKILRLFGGKQLLTRNSSKNLFEDSFFSSKKIETEFNFKFSPLKEVLSKTAKFYITKNDLSE